MLDEREAFETGRPAPVCGNTADMLSLTRYAPHFRVDGDEARHHGLFGGSSRTGSLVASDSSSSCC